MVYEYFVILIISNYFIFGGFMDNILSLDNFDKALKEKGLNLKQLAQKYDQKYGTEKGETIYNTLRKWHQGNGNPTLEKLIRICDILGCDVDFLLGRIEDNTHAIKFIREKTGFSKEAIDRIISKNGNTPNQDFLNSFITSDEYIEIEEKIWLIQNDYQNLLKYGKSNFDLERAATGQKDNPEEIERLAKMQDRIYYNLEHNWSQIKYTKYECSLSFSNFLNKFNDSCEMEIKTEYEKYTVE